MRKFIPVWIAAAVFVGAISYNAIATNPTTGGGGVAGPLSYKPFVLEATSGAERSIDLNPDLEYLVMHDGEDTSGTADTNTIYLSVAASVDADPDSGPDKAKLLDQRSFPIGPGIKTLKFRTASGAPTFTVICGPSYRGKY